MIALFIFFVPIALLVFVGYALFSRRLSVVQKTLTLLAFCGALGVCAAHAYYMTLPYQQPWMRVDVTLLMLVLWLAVACVATFSAVIRPSDNRASIAFTATAVALFPLVALWVSLATNCVNGNCL
jgi:hypothetical protein